MSWCRENAKEARKTDLFRLLSEQGELVQGQYGRGGDPANHVEFESELKRRQEAELKRQQEAELKRQQKRKSKRKGKR